MMKRVCHISTVHPQNDVRVFHRECKSLVDAGYEIHLIIDSARDGLIDGVYVHKLTKPGKRLMRMIISPWRALFKALKIKSDIYHYHDPELLPMGFLLRWLFNKKVVFDIHESVPRQIMGKEWLPVFCRKVVSLTYKIIERALLTGQEVIIANENSVDDYSSRAYLVKNYPKIDKMMLAELQNAQKSKKIRLIYLGGVSKIRGALIYIELAKHLHEKGYDFELCLIGQYPEDLKQEMDERISRYGLDSKVQITGRMDQREALRIVADSHVGLCLLKPVPNYVTCLATKILEYMMLGVPVLASDFDCWRKYVEGENTGLMADPEDIESIVSKCEHLLNNPDECFQMAENGKKAVIQKFNWETEFNELLRCYDNLLADKA